MVPKYYFLTNGVGRNKENLASFEAALRDAGISQYNLVTVSSIIPPKCAKITREQGIQMLKPGAIVFLVLARNSTNEDHRLIAASIGLAIPSNPDEVGYLSEHHSFGETDEFAGEYSEDLAASMLATTVGIPFDINAAWNEKEQVFKASGRIIRTMNVTQSAVGDKGVWTSVVAAAVFIMDTNSTVQP
ncbi:MAG: arginine decarboxylase, pyruvoyl-dependent [Thaumarchaeota archaeon]|nr:arginine decarboxylase, pyruvoyl-dependent [Nitrososphaerota archaeon]